MRVILFSKHKHFLLFIPLQIALFVLPTLLFCKSLIAEEISEAEIIKAEKQSIEARKRITSGHFLIAKRKNTFDEKQTNSEIQYEIYLNNEKKRMDLKKCNLEEVCENISSTVFTKDSHIRVPIAGNSEVQFFGPTTKAPKTIEIPNPCLLGFVAWNFDSIDQYGLEYSLLVPDREKVSAKKNTYNGDQVLEIAYQKTNKLGNSVFTEYKLAVEKDFHPLYMTIYVKSGETELQRDVLENEVAFNVRGKTWFPTKVTYKRISGGKLEEEEIETVKIAEINTEVDDQKFTLAGLGIKEGKLVDHDGHLMWWTGRTLVPKYVDQNEYQGNQLKPRKFNFFLILNAIIFAILAIAFIFLRLRGSKISSS